MSTFKRRIAVRASVATVVGVALATILTGCIVIPLGGAVPVAPAPSPVPSSPVPSSPAPPSRGERVLADFIETERATIPLAMAALGETIADIIVDGHFREGTHGAPDVTTLSFRYVFSRTFSFPPSSTDWAGSDLQLVCAGVFRDMRAFGVEGRIDLTYVLEDRSGEVREFPCEREEGIDGAPDDGLTIRRGDQ
jgi:hypothetical protein